MDFLSGGILELIFKLLPGFLAAAIVYSLTAHPRPAAFERVVQALIYTIIIQGLVFLVKSALLLLGQCFHWGTWSDGAELVTSVIIAIAFGLLWACNLNHDWTHRLLRRLGLTKRTAMPSEWYSAFSARERWVVLHLSGDRRIVGWPEQWPDHPDKGEFVLLEPQWLLSDGAAVPVLQDERILVRCTDVEMVEFLKYASDVNMDGGKLEELQKPLVEKASDQEKLNGS